MTLKLGSSISAASVKEGEDIYLECGVQVSWMMMITDDGNDIDDHNHLDNEGEDMYLECGVQVSWNLRGCDESWGDDPDDVPMI